MRNDTPSTPPSGERPNRGYGPEIIAEGPGWVRTNRRQAEHAAPPFSDREDAIGAVRQAGWLPMRSDPEEPLLAFPAGKGGQCGCPACAGTVSGVKRGGGWELTGGVCLEVPPSMWREDTEAERCFFIQDIATGQAARLNKVPTPKAARKILRLSALPRHVRRRRVRRRRRPKAT